MAVHLRLAYRSPIINFLLHSHEPVIGAAVDPEANVRQPSVSKKPATLPEQALQQPLPPPPLEATTDRQLWEAFTEMDADKNGSLDAAELSLVRLPAPTLALPHAPMNCPQPSHLPIRIAI
jgi:hypothetical protein